VVPCTVRLKAATTSEAATTNSPSSQSHSLALNATNGKENGLKPDHPGLPPIVVIPAKAGIQCNGTASSGLGSLWRPPRVLMWLASPQ
jgi:hypothetical protein